MKRDRGSAATELVVLVPLVALIIGFVILAGRLSTAQQDVTSASQDAARAASVRGLAGDPVGRATLAARQTLASRDVTCQQVGVDVDVTQLRPGGQVSVTVSCTIGLSDVLGLGIANASRTVSATATAVVDTYLTNLEDP